MAWSSRGALFAASFLGCFAFGTCVAGAGCATADDSDFDLPTHTTHDGGVQDSASGGDTTTSSDSTTHTDSGAPIDSGSSIDSRVGPDTSVAPDTYVPPPDTTPIDTGSGFPDLGVPDTAPVDTGTGGGSPCVYCEGTCTDEFIDEECFITCIGGGSLDCIVSGTTCTCL